MIDHARSSEGGQASDELSLLDFATLVAKYKKTVFGLPLVGGLLSVVVALLLPPIYTATTRLLPPQQKESSAVALLGALATSAAAGHLAAAQDLGLRNPNELYVGILNSHTIADRLIERFNLKELYETSSTVQARKALQEVTRVSAGKDGLITIEVDDRDPQRAAEIANGYVAELDTLMQGLAVTEAAQRRLFFERQLAVAREKLIVAEAALRRAIDTKGIAGIDAQSRALVAATEHLRAQIAMKEIQLDAMRAYATDKNPEAVRLRQELASIRNELANLEGGRTSAKDSSSPTGLETVRRLREVKFLEATVELLAKQYEIAKIDEARDAVLIQVVDRATPPDYRSKPKRALIVVVTVFMCAVLGLLSMVVRESIDRAQQRERR